MSTALILVILFVVCNAIWMVALAMDSRETPLAESPKAMPKKDILSRVVLATVVAIALTIMVVVA